MSTDLFVVRHAEAEEQDATRWPDDARRPLTKDGIKRFERAAKGLTKIAAAPVAVLSSPFTRARETAAILSAKAGWPEPSLSDALIPGRHPKDTLELLDGTTTCAIVGHEPHLSIVIGELCGGEVEMKKGAVALLRVEAFAPGGAVLRWLVSPKVLRQL